MPPSLAKFNQLENLPTAITDTEAPVVIPKRECDLEAPVSPLQGR